MSGARHEHHLSGDFQFHDELASLFAHQRPDAAPMAQPWFMDYLHATAAAASPLDCDAFVGDFIDVPAVAADEVVKRELVMVDTAAAGSGGGTPTPTTAPLTPNSMSMSSTSSEACGAGAGAGEESAAGKCKKEDGEEEGLESKDDGSAAGKGDGGEGEEKNKKG
jgi:hypothetical protein